MILLSYKLVNVGRGKFNGVVSVRDERGLVTEIRKHLASRDVEVIWKNASLREGTVVVGGMRPVGTVEFIGSGHGSTEGMPTQ